jgi:exodeoxyribonuclease VII large subunit
LRVIEPREAPAARTVWAVGALLLATGDALAARFGAVAVRGELSGFARAASGHCYFALKDDTGATALIRCAMFRRAAGLVDFAPADGQRVELRGRLGVYEARGELQMVVESMQRVGAGSLYEEFLRLRARLEAQGLFDPARKRPLPSHPGALGVVTSLGAAALRDVLTALARRAPHVRVVVYPTPVQGIDAPPALVAALEQAGRRREVDALLLVRGGGSLEDLWAFNDERVVRAIVASPLPVVCGVGHETDVTLADMAADLRAPTPTAAAELAAPVRDESLAALDARGAALVRSLERALQSRAQRLDLLAARLGAPAQRLRGQRDRLDALSSRLARALPPVIAQRRQAIDMAALRIARGATLALQQRHARIDATAARLEAQDPHRVLQRGYAWVEAEDGRAVASVHAVRPGQRVRAVWADGRARADIVDVEPLPPSRE